MLSLTIIDVVQAHTSIRIANLDIHNVVIYTSQKQHRKCVPVCIWLWLYTNQTSIYNCLQCFEAVGCHWENYMASTKYRSCAFRHWHHCRPNSGSTFLSPSIPFPAEAQSQLKQVSYIQDSTHEPQLQFQHCICQLWSSIPDMTNWLLKFIVVLRN